jgi:hypothetical protein
VLDESQLRVVQGSSPGDDVCVDCLVRVGVAWPARRGGNPSGFVGARLENHSNAATVREADEPLLAEAALDGFDARLPQETATCRRRQPTAAAGARRDEGDPDEGYGKAAVPLNT